MYSVKALIILLILLLCLGLVCTNETDQEDRYNDNTNYSQLIFRLYGESSKNPGGDVGLGHVQYGVEGKYYFDTEGRVTPNMSTTLSTAQNIKETGVNYFCKAYMVSTSYDSTSIWVAVYKKYNGQETLLKTSNRFDPGDTIYLTWKP
jgi:hypothetical protein